MKNTQRATRNSFLALTRCREEDIVIILPDKREVVVRVADIRGDKVRLAVSADRDIIIHRAEIVNDKLELEGVRVAGLFQLHDTKGFSLTDSLVQCGIKGGMPDWADFFREAKKAGWPFERVEQKVREAICDSGWKETWSEVAHSVLTHCRAEFANEIRQPPCK